MGSNYARTKHQYKRANLPTNFEQLLTNAMVKLCQRKIFFGRLLFTQAFDISCLGRNFPTL